MGATGRNIRAGRAFVEIVLSQSALERGLRRAQRKLKGFADAVGALGSSMAALGTSLAAPMALAARSFASFDDGMRTVRAVANATEKDFLRLTETAEKLGRETSFTAKEVASGMAELGRMGFSSDEILDATPAVLDLARATGTSLADAAQTAANNMRVFGMDASRTREAADILAATANGSAQTLSDLAEALRMAGPQASAAGDDIRSVAASLGVLANMGIRGSLAGTALRKAYSQFAKESVRGKLASLGIATADATGNLRALPETMADIAAAMGRMPTATKLAFAEEIFDLRGALAGLQLGGNIGQLRQFLGMLENADGAAERTAKAMDAGIGGSLRRLSSALEGLGIAVGRILGEAVSPYVERLSKLLNGLAVWAKAHRNAVLMAAKAAAVLLGTGAGLLALGAAIRLCAVALGGLNALFVAAKTVVLLPLYAVGALAFAYNLLTAAMAVCRSAAVACWAVVSAPPFLAAAGLAAATALVWKFAGAWDACRDAALETAADFGDAFRDIGETFSRTWETMKAALQAGDLSGAAKAGLAGLSLAWQEGLLPLRKAWIAFSAFLRDAWTVFIYGILGTWDFLWDGLLSGLRQAGDAIADVWGWIWNGIRDGFSRTCEWIEKQWTRLKGIFSDDEAVDAALEAIGRKYADARDEREREFAASVLEREESRNAAAEARRRERPSVQQARDAELLESMASRDREVAEAEKAVEAARSEWKSALEEVRRGVAEKSAAAEERRRRLGGNAAFATRTAAGRAGVAPEGGSASSFGSWSLRELSGLFGKNGCEERTALASEASVRLQEEANRCLRRLSEREETQETELLYGE